MNSLKETNRLGVRGSYDSHRTTGLCICKRKKKMVSVKFLFEKSNSFEKANANINFEWDHLKKSKLINVGKRF